MKIYRRFPRDCNSFKPRLNQVKGVLLLGMVMLAVLSPKVGAFTLDVQVTDGSGGRVASVPGNSDCVPECTLYVSSQTIVSLFALPDKGYRFKGWKGACANTIGPLCTLRPSENSSASARFAKTAVPKTATKALLLLHGEGLKHTVWNDFIKQHFNNRCPVVYGGVVMGEDSFDPSNDVYCYRIAFGYYDMLKQSLAARTYQKTGNVRKAKDGFSSKPLGYEVRAAVLGVLDRHPNLSMTLVGQGRAASAAQSFLRTHTAERSSIVGLLALQQSSQDRNGVVSDQSDHQAFPAKRTATLKLDVDPEQDGKISAALAQLTKSWWMAR